MIKKIISCTLILAIVLGLLQGVLPTELNFISNSHAVNFDSSISYPFDERNINITEIKTTPRLKTVSGGTYYGEGQYYDSPGFGEQKGLIADLVVQGQLKNKHNQLVTYTSAALCLDRLAYGCIC